MSLQWHMTDQPFNVTLHGVSKQVPPGDDYGTTIKELLDKLWAEVRGQALPNRGLTHMVYEEDGTVFVGVELELPASRGEGAVDDVPNLAKRAWTLNEYAYCVHRGHYGGLGRTYDELHAAVSAAGRQCKKPLVEAYGHWKEDESQMETGIYFSLA